MSTHTQGRLRVTHNSWEVSTLHCDGIAVARVHIDSDVDERTQQHLESVKEANARRLVACWNACDGIPTDMLEAMPFGPAALVPMYARLEAQRDELLAFAQEWLERQGTDENYMTAKARAAIAKAIG